MEQDKIVVSVSPKEEGLEERDGAGLGGGQGIAAGAVTTAQLRSRIEQQSSLIAMLKQRNDNTFEELGRCKILYEKVAAEKKELGESLAKSNQAASVIEQRFHTLSHNHDELTKIMEEYKSDNKKLRAELDSRDSRVVMELREREKQLETLRQEMKGKNARIRVLEGRCVILEEEIRDMQKSKDSRMEELSKKLHTQQEEHKVATDLLNKAKTKLTLLEEKLSKLRQRNNELQLSLNQSVTLAKERMLENEKLKLEIKKLLSDKDALAQEIKIMKVEWTRDAQITRLEKELRDEKREKEKLQKEYIAFKKHSSELLRKEKELNSKLRHFSDI